MGHYFIYDPNRKEKSYLIEGFIKGVKYRFYADGGIFSAKNIDFGTIQLIENIVVNNEVKTVLDLGSGYGVIGIVLKSLNERLIVTHSDINQLAINLTEKNVNYYKQNNKIILSDGFINIKEKYDLITLNPPIRAGKEVIFKLYKDSYNYLNDGGEFYIVVKKSHGAPSHLSFLKEIFKKVDVVAKKSGYYVIKSKK